MAGAKNVISEREQMNPQDSATLDATMEEPSAKKFRGADSKLFLFIAPLMFGTLTAFALSKWVALGLFAGSWLAVFLWCSDKSNTTTAWERFVTVIPIAIIFLVFDRYCSGQEWPIIPLAALSMLCLRWRKP